MYVNIINKMKIFQVKYNQDRYCYYKIDKRENFNESTKLYKDYTSCLEEKEEIDGFELVHIKKALIKYFNK